MSVSSCKDTSYIGFTLIIFLRALSSDKVTLRVSTSTYEWGGHNSVHNRVTHTFILSLLLHTYTIHHNKVGKTYSPGLSVSSVGQENQEYGAAALDSIIHEWNTYLVEITLLSASRGYKDVVTKARSSFQETRSLPKTIHKTLFSLPSYSPPFFNKNSGSKPLDYYISF